MPAVEVSELTVMIGAHVTAVDDATFSVGAGEVVALLGPNGAGKTTTIETIEGYRAPHAGSVRVLDSDPLTDRAALATRWGVMPQAGGLPMGLTVREAIELFRGLHESEATTGEIMERTRLTELADRRWRRLSGGEQQRLSLALALCGGRDLLLLDEPTAALDAVGRVDVLRLIRDRAKQGTAVLLTTHLFADVEQIADRVVVLDRGRVIKTGTVAELTTGHRHIRFTTEPGLELAELSTRVGGHVTETSPGRYEAAIEPTAQGISEITTWLAQHNLVASSIEAGSKSLEELMLELGTDPR